jgi:aminopeptidase N
MLAKNATAPTIYLKDYTPPVFLLTHCDLDFTLSSDNTLVTARYDINANPENGSDTLILDGENLTLISIAIDGETLAQDRYKYEGDLLSIFNMPSSCSLTIENSNDPAANTALSGLYKSGDMLCTQCEAQGFRRITFSLDRPDVLCTYKVTLRANKSDYPLLLSNGNLVDSGEQDGLHYACWDDPHPKPTYLFALVAGDLACDSDTFTTQSGRVVDLHVLTRPEDADKTQHAMESLKRSMLWDEEVYGLEYDLDVYHIVAVSDFNMGAMENKSLNIFNTRYVLANPNIATDSDYHNIEGVIGHEYFHNWSGNRVTCRDWFQLSLKEGFTVLRDQTFSADMGSAGVQRINDVIRLRTAQFKEDAGPTAHSVRPDKYEEINNFYTATVYEKGAEVVGMLRTLVGVARFRKGTDLYFKRFDGQAVTTDDFVACMEEVSNRDFTQFKRWYSQAGTPALSVTSMYDSIRENLTLHFKQTVPDTPGQTNKQATLIPVRCALLAENGERIPFELDNKTTDEAVLEIDQTEQTITLYQVTQRPIPSLLRGFSAPVKLEIEQDNDTLSFLMAHDDDPFNRWEASQSAALNEIEQCMASDTVIVYSLQPHYAKAIENILDDETTDPALLAQLLSLPSESIISQSQTVIDPDLIHAAREQVIGQIAQQFGDKLSQRYQQSSNANDGSWTTEQVAHRSLRDTCLSILSRLDTAASQALAFGQYENAQCMTDTIAAMGNIISSSHAERQSVVVDFHSKWQSEDLLIYKWLSLQATQQSDDTLAIVKNLTTHSDFDQANPNKVYSLIGGYLHSNPTGFHQLSGEGYAFAAQWVLILDALNPQVASRMVQCFNQWKRYDNQRQAMMKKEMLTISKHDGLSPDVSEIITKALG